MDFETILHPRIESSCNKLLADGHYKYAALEAMMQVEKALKEKTAGNISENLFGVMLAGKLFGEGKGTVKLWVPFGEIMQRHAATLFKGAFAYYRNYSAHDGSNIDEQSSMRIMVIASELLDLIGASSMSFTDIGGIEGLLRQGVFSDEEDIYTLLRLMDGYTLPDDESDGFYEEIFLKGGYDDAHVLAVIEVGLVIYRSEEFIPPEGSSLNDIFEPLYDTIGWFELTELGKKLLAEQDSEKLNS